MHVPTCLWLTPARFPPQAAITRRSVLVVRHGERVDQVFGKSWLQQCSAPDGRWLPAGVGAGTRGLAHVGVDARVPLRSVTCMRVSVRAVAECHLGCPRRVEERLQWYAVRGDCFVRTMRTLEQVTPASLKPSLLARTLSPAPSLCLSGLIFPTAVTSLSHLALLLNARPVLNVPPADPRLAPRQASPEDGAWKPAAQSRDCRAASVPALALTGSHAS